MKFIGNWQCKNNALSPELRCAINPDGPCEGCESFVPGKVRGYRMFLSSYLPEDLGRRIPRITNLLVYFLFFGLIFANFSLKMRIKLLEADRGEKVCDSSLTYGDNK